MKFIVKIISSIFQFWPRYLTNVTSIPYLKKIDITKVLNLGILICPYIRNIFNLVNVKICISNGYPIPPYKIQCTTHFQFCVRAWFKLSPNLFSPLPASSHSLNLSNPNATTYVLNIYLIMFNRYESLLLWDLKYCLIFIQLVGQTVLQKQWYLQYIFPSYYKRE